MILYKLTNENDKTYNDTQWGENITHKASGEGEICGPGFIHAYKTPHHAILFNPIHGGFDIYTMNLWECKGDGVKSDGLKIGCNELTTIKRITIPEISIRQKIYFGYLCAKDILYIFEKKFPGDKRPRQALDEINKFLNGEKINKKKLIKLANAANKANADVYIINTANILAYVAYAAAYTCYAVIQNFSNNSINRVSDTIADVAAAIIHVNKKIIDENIKNMFKFS